MKKPFKVSLVLTLITVLLSCSKDEDETCYACNLEGIEICEVASGEIQIFENGKEIGDIITLPEDIGFNSAAQQLCAEIERQVAQSGDCYVCMGPNVIDFNVCKTEAGITLNNELIPDTASLGLEEAIELLEANPNNDSQFEGLACQRN